MASKNVTAPTVPTSLDASKASKPTPTALKDIPSDVTITVTNVEGQSRTKYLGFLDDAKSIQVSLYYPQGMDIPDEGEVLTIARFGKDEDVESDTYGEDVWLFGKGADARSNPEQGQDRTRKGSVKHAWGDLNNSDEFGSAAFVPARARLTTITAVLG